MNKFNLQKKTRRFLIVWYLFHGVAFFVNIIGVDKNYQWKIDEFTTETDYRPCKGDAYMFFYPLTSSSGGSILDKDKKGLFLKVMTISLKKMRTSGHL